MSVWPYDLIAHLYDHDMGLNAGGEDLAGYLELVGQDLAATSGQVLELGCGTGRITWPLAGLERPVVALDRSEPMIRRLLAKAAGQPRPQCLVADMARPALTGRFASIVCAYSAFTYVLGDQARAATLSFVREHLEQGGRLHLDVFVPDPALRFDEEVFDYRRRFHGAWLERRKRVTRHAAEVNRVARRYTVLDDAGRVLGSIETESFQRVVPPADLLQTLHEAGLAPARIAGDFAGGPLRPDSRVLMVSASSR